MNRETKQLTGAWIQAIGTVTAAVGSTPSELLHEEHQRSLALWGNVLQASGNSLIADAERNFTLGKLGNIIQAIGNLTVVAGILLPLTEKAKQTFDINGNLIQAVGGGVSLSEGLGEQGTSGEEIYAIGDTLQVIGNSFQAFGGSLMLREWDEEDVENKRGILLGFQGGWIQAAGSVLQALQQTKDAASTGFQHEANS
ncbi:MAG TPA: hypothetical protein VIG80_04235 [Bacillaceae bacterium]